MPSIGLAELLGVKGKTIQWERPLLFFAALFISGLVWFILAPPVSYSLRGVSVELSQFLPAWLWLDHFLSSMVLAGLALAAFRFMPYPAAAVPALAIMYSLWTLADRALLLPRLMEPPQTATDLWNPVRLIAPALWICVFFAALAAALRWIRQVWLALILGATAGPLVDNVLLAVLNYLLRKEVPSLGPELSFLPFILLHGASIGGVLWAGLWLSSDRPAAPGAPAPRLRKGFYLGTLIVAYALPFLVAVAVAVLAITHVWKPRDLAPAMILLGMAGVLMVYGVVVLCVFIYRMWVAIQDGYPRTSPGRALGFLFIPIYQFYWLFQAFPGFAKDFNAFVARHFLNIPQLSSGLFTAYAILAVAQAVPWLDVLLFPAWFIVMLVMVSRVCNAVNSIPRTLPAAAPTIVATGRQ